MSHSPGPATRILLVCDHASRYSPTGDALEIAKALAAPGRRVDLLPLEGRFSESCADNVRLIEHRSVIRFGFDSVRQIRTAIQQDSHDLVICIGAAAIRSVPVACLGMGVPLFAIHCSTERLARGFVGWHEKKILSRYRAHLHRNPEDAECLTIRFPDWYWAVLPWTQCNVTEDAPRHELLRELGIPGNAKLAGTCDPFERPCRLKDFIWAGDLMKCIRDDVYWLLIGHGPQHWRLQRFADHLEIGDNLIFVDWNQAAGILPQLDVYVQASPFVSSCRGLSLALFHGLPLVTTSDPLHRQFVKHGRNGYVVERGARNEIARCVNRLVNEPALSQSFSGYSKQLARDVLSPAPNLVERILEPHQSATFLTAQTKRLAS